MRPTKTPPVTVSLIALNTRTNRVERLIHVGRVHTPATARDHAARMRAFRAAGIVPAPEPIEVTEWRPTAPARKPEPMMLF